MSNELSFRLATKDDVIAIVEMLLDDTLGTTRESFDKVLLDKYFTAFDKIIADPNQELTIVELNGIKVATFQLTFIQYLTHQGGIRLQVEAVRTSSKYRGQGIGKKVFEYIIARAKEKGCIMVQLTTDKKRSEAIKFYENLGFISTHEGMKFKL